MNKVMKNLKKAIYMTMALFLASCSLSHSQSREGSAFFKEIVKRHQMNNWDLDVLGLPKVSIDSIPKDGKNIEVFKMPARPGVEDAFEWEIILVSDSRMYWLVRSGGFDGKRVAFGPGKIK